MWSLLQSRLLLVVLIACAFNPYVLVTSWSLPAFVSTKSTCPAPGSFTSSISFASSSSKYDDVRSRRRARIVVRMSDEEESAEAVAEEEEAPSPPPPPAPKSGLSMRDVRRLISNLDADNFTKNLDEMEPFLLHESGQTFYNKCMQRIQYKVKTLNGAVSMPDGYAKEAKATAKRREKQDAFIKAKEEEAKVAAAGETEAAPAEAEAVAAE